ncbi:hypothetical protein DFP73DRAFT_64433 [Morchella snyderi]|nr:hypothetical protein DFP73DRAFT_64433 [Morchella snyderi]
MPPSIASALHPIVLPPVPVPPYFTTLGAGLLHATQPRELPSTLHTLLFSHPPLANKDRPKSWWRAQCLLYGLDAPEKRTIPELRAMLQNAILQGGLRVPDAMQELEKRENGRFRKLNAEMREATGVAPRGKAPPKDPLKGIRGQGAKVAKAAGRKPAARAGGDVTVNITVNMPNPQATKAQAKKTQPASRPKQTAKRGGAAPKTARSKGSAAPTQPAATSRAKQTAKRGGAAPKTARPKGSAAPKGRATTTTRAEPIMAWGGRGGGGALARDSGAADHQVPVEDEDEGPYGGDSDYGDYGFCGTRQFSDQGMYGDEEEGAAVAGSGQAAWVHSDHEDYEDYERHESYQGSDDYQGHDMCQSW